MLGKLGFGLMRLPVKSGPTDIDQEQLNAMVDLFLERGFTYFDTSFVYHNGESENAIRRALVERHDRNSFTLASKLPAFAITEEKDMEPTFELQLKKCGVEYFDYYLLHNMKRTMYDTNAKTCKMFEYLKKWKEEGKIRHIGFSFHDSASVLDTILTEHPEIEFVQIAYNYLDKDAELLQAQACYDVIVKHGRKVVVMEPVKGGALAALPEKSLARFAALNNGSAASYAIRWTNREEVIATLSGMSTLAQVEDNTSYMMDFKPITQEEQKVIDEVVQDIKDTYVVKGNMDVLKEISMGLFAAVEGYNNCMVQPNPYFAAELNYYKSYKLGVDRFYETADLSKYNEAFGGDVNAIRDTAIEFHVKNTF